jgi:hypothetical protein
MRIAWRGAIVLALGAAACVAPARSFDAYEGKAVTTSDSVRSSVETGRLAAVTAQTDGAFAPTLSVVLSDAEGDASSARTTFESIQPPDGPSDALRSQLMTLLDRAVAGLSRLRISARRGDIAGLARLSRPLAAVSQQLEAFSNAHS